MYSYEKILETLQNETFGKSCGKTIEMLRANIRDQEATKKGVKKPYKIIDKMMKDAAKSCSWQTRFQKAHKYSGGFGFLDGYRIFFSDDTLGYEEADPENTFNIDQIITEKHNLTNTVKIDVADLRYYIKAGKPGRRGDRYEPYIIYHNNEYIGFNPHFLIDLIEYAGTDTLIYTGRKNPFYADNMKAMLLPVNIAWAGDHDAAKKYTAWREKYFVTEGGAVA